MRYYRQNYGKQNRHAQHHANGMVACFSYRTLVAVFYKSLPDGGLRTSQYYSVTTSRHCNAFDREFGPFLKRTPEATPEELYAAFDNINAMSNKQEGGQHA